MLKGKSILVAIGMAMIVCAIAFWGCENSTVSDTVYSESLQSPIVDSENGSVETNDLEWIFSPIHLSLGEWRVGILNARLNSTERNLTLLMDVSRDILPPLSRRFTIQFYEGADAYVGYTSSLFDQDGLLLWEFDFAVDTHDYNNFYFAERTSSDSLTIDHQTGKSSYVETYTINEDTRSFHFPTQDASRVAELREAVFSETIMGAPKACLLLIVRL